MAKVGDGRELQGTVAFSAVGRPHYGFDVFTIDLPESFRSADADSKTFNEKRLTDGKSVNFNAQFVDGSDALVLLQGNAFIRPPNTCVDFIDGEGMAMAVVHVSERNGAPRIYFSYEDQDARKVVLGPLLNATALNHNNNSDDEPFFFDRPIVKNGKVYFVSSQDPADKALKSWSAVYSTCLRTGHTVRLTPPGVVDYSPSISPSGKWIAVASYGGTREWEGQDEDLETDLYVLNAEDGSNRTLLVHGGGWPTWADDRTLYFHKRAPDGWWSVYRLKLTMPIPPLPSDDDVQRITPPSIHAFTPCASPTREWIAVATRRPDSKFRHIEIFHLPSNSFIALTNSLNPEIHHYNPFVSANSKKIGFHRFRGPVAREDDDAVVPYLESVRSPLPRLKMLRINGFFPAFSPDGSLIAYNPYLTIAYNPDLTQNEGGVCIVKADASKMWKIFQGPAFAVAWNGKQKGVVYATLGPIFAADRATVHIISITFDPQELGDDEEKGVKTQVRFLTKDGTNNNAFPFSSPDGKQLVFRSGRSGHKNLYIMDAERGEEGGIVRLTEGEWIDTMPCWSPDGQWIAFSSNRHLHLLVSTDLSCGVAEMAEATAPMVAMEVSHPPMEQLQGGDYCIDSNPPWPEAIVLAFQHYILMLGTTAMIPTFLVPMMGGDDGDKARVIQTLLFVAGLNTILQSLFGTRLPTVVGGSFAFVIPVISIISDSSLQSIPDQHERFVHTMRATQGALIASSSLQIILGYSQLWGICSRFFSPLGTVPVISLVGLGLLERGFPEVGKCVEIGVPMLIIFVAFQQYLKHLRPRHVPIFERFALLICVTLVWAYAHLLTASGAYKHKSDKTQDHCRTDRANLISSAPWIKFPYPLQWGAPTFNAGHAFGMMAAALVSLVESSGAYLAASRLASATPPPAYVLSRGIGWQGIGTLLDGLFGTGTGSTVSVENVGLLGTTRVGSRRVVQISAGFMIFFSILGKFGALFASIPFPIYAAVYCVLFGLVAAVGISFLQFTNLNSMRNLFILGLSLFLGLSIPQYFNEFVASAGHGPVHTKSGWFNDFLNTIFSSPPTVALIVAVFLDNTLEVWNSKKDRGMPWWVKFRSFKGDSRNEEFYTLPFNLNKFFPPT